MLSAWVNDTDTGAPTGGNVNCTFWITTDGSTFDSGHSALTNTSGYCNYLFTPDGNYSVGNHTWKAGVTYDTYYAESNSSNFIMTVKGRINITATRISRVKPIRINNHNHLRLSRNPQTIWHQSMTYSHCESRQNGTWQSSVLSRK